MRPNKPFKPKPLRGYEVHGIGRMACIEKSTGRLVGFSGLKFLEDLQDVDIGYRFLPDCWGKGHATESAQFLVKHGYSALGLSRIIGLVRRGNAASANVPQKAGLCFERIVHADSQPGRCVNWAYPRRRPKLRPQTQQDASNNPMHKILLAFMALSLHLPAQAAQTPADEASRARILTLTLEQVFDKPVEGGPSTVRPIVAAPDVTLPANLTAFGQPLSLKTRDAAKAEQLAWFVYVSKVTLGPDQASVAYQTPYNGKYGTATFSKTDGQWTVQDHQRMHSSSGARNFYGELYEGTDCRDGSEMAKRWNTYKDAMEAAMARRQRTAESALPSTCPGKEFPDVVSYKQLKALRLNK